MGALVSDQTAEGVRGGDIAAVAVGGRGVAAGTGVDVGRARVAVGDGDAAMGATVCVGRITVATRVTWSAGAGKLDLQLLRATPRRIATRICSKRPLARRRSRRGVAPLSPLVGLMVMLFATPSAILHPRYALG